MSARPVLIELESLGKTIYGEVAQLTMTGATIQPTDPLILWGNVRLRVRFGFADTTYTLTGLSKESNPDHSFSFTFDTVTRQQMTVYGAALRQTGVLEAGAPESAPAPNGPALNSGTVAKNAPAAAAVTGAASKGKQPAAEPIDPSRIVRHQGPPEGKERRTSHRYDLEVDAALTVVNTPGTQPAKVIEIGAGGCRVFTPKPNQIQPGTAVEVNMAGLNFPLRLSAMVLHKQSDQVLGLQFHELSHRIQGRLVNFINELRQGQSEESGS
jgi:hypothetical protein